jgi:hypothetical protein
LTADDRFADRATQLCFGNWLGQELEGTALHCRDGRRHIAIAGNENDRNVRLVVSDALLKIESVEVGKRNIENQARGPVYPGVRENA